MPGLWNVIVQIKIASHFLTSVTIGFFMRRSSTPARKSTPAPTTSTKEHAAYKHEREMLQKKRQSCCEWMKYRTMYYIDKMTGESAKRHKAKKERKRAVRQQKKAIEKAENEPVIAGGLQYTRPFLRGQGSPAGVALQIDRPIAAGPIKILHQSDRLIVVAKPAPIPSEKNTDYTRAHMRSVLKHQLNLSGRMSALHRLDICTTGVMLWTTSKASARCFTKKIRDREVQKCYLALVRGQFPMEPTKCEVDVDHKESSTEFYRLSFNQNKHKHQINDDGDVSLVLCVPKTGRKHQIRKHLKCLGHPIANDPRYGGAVGQQDRRANTHKTVYANPKVASMFRAAWTKFSNMENVAGLNMLKEHVDCCDRVGSGDYSVGGPWITTWMEPIYLHAWMYFGHGGVRDEADLDPWCFCAPAPKWAEGMDLARAPDGIRRMYDAQVS